MGTMHFNSFDEVHMDQIPAVIDQQRTITNSNACVVILLKRNASLLDLIPHLNGSMIGE